MSFPDAVLQLIRKTTADRGFPPSLQEMSKTLGRGVGEVKLTVRGLVADGRLRGNGNGVIVAAPHPSALSKLPQRVTITAIGTPRPQGSKRAFVGPGGKAVIRESSAGLDFWRQIVYTAALEHGPAAPLEGPVAVEVTFYLRRPKNPAHPVPASRPDADKLLRAVLDSLTDAAVYSDDGQVVDAHARKRYAPDGIPRAEVVIQPWGGDAA